VIPVEEALVITEEEAKMFWEKRLRKRREEDPREKVSVTEGVVLPAIWSLSVGVVTPIPIFPLAKIVKSDTPVEEATLNGLSPVEVALCTLSVKLDDVALIPSTVPLSINVEVPTVVEVSQRVAYPNAPPVTPTLVRPSVDVDTHCVEVPVERSNCPRVPEAFVESLKEPERLRLVE
jgi:hypothetical protein